MRQAARRARRHLRSSSTILYRRSQPAGDPTADQEVTEPQGTYRQTRALAFNLHVSAPAPPTSSVFIGWWEISCTALSGHTVPVPASVMLSTGSFRQATPQATWAHRNAGGRVRRPRRRATLAYSGHCKLYSL